MGQPVSQDDPVTCTNCGGYIPGGVIWMHECGTPELATVAELRPAPAAASAHLRDRVLTTAQIENLPPPDPIVAGYLHRDSLAVLYGPPGAAKSFAAIDIAMSITTGSWWHGHEVTPGPVLYIVAEGASGVGARTRAWRQHHGIHQPEKHHPIHWIPRPVQLLDPVATAELGEVCADLAPILVVVDTLARCTLGAEENSAKDMGAVVDTLDQIRRSCAACVLALHHSGKDNTKGARGSTALLGAVDTELSIAAEDPYRVLRTTKQKDGPEASDLRLSLVPVGDSCVLGAPTQPAADGLPDRYRQVLDSLAEIELPGGVPAGRWAGASPSPERSHFRAVKSLVELGLVVNVGTEKAPRYLTADYAADAAGMH